MARKKASLDFEQSLADLQTLVERLENGELSLEDSLTAFEQGIRLTRECQGALAQARERLLAGESSSQFEGGGAESPATVRLEVHDEAMRRHCAEQVVHRRARDAQLIGDRPRRDGPALAREKGEDAQRLVGRGYLRGGGRGQQGRCGCGGPRNIGGNLRSGRGTR